MSEKMKAVAVAMAIAGMDVCNVDSDSSDSDNGSERRSRRIENFVEGVVASFDDDEFRRHFRLSRPTFELLVNLIGRHVSTDVDGTGRPSVGVHKQLLMTLWTLATPDSYR